MMRAALSVAPDAAFRRYLGWLRRLPPLSPEAELLLARRWKEKADAASAYALAAGHLRLAAKVAARYRGCGLPMIDLVAEGNAGLCRAISRFDPDRDARLAVFAAPWIDHAIRRHIARARPTCAIGRPAAACGVTASAFPAPTARSSRPAI